jgi:protein NRD1
LPRTSDHELKGFFGRFGGVQSCIVNHDKRHAFLKLISHQDAIATKTSVEALPDSEYRSMFERVCYPPTSSAFEIADMI